MNYTKILIITLLSLTSFAIQIKKEDLDISNIKRVGICKFSNDDGIRYIKDPCQLETAALTKECYENKEKFRKESEAFCSAQVTQQSCLSKNSYNSKTYPCTWSGEDQVDLSDEQIEDAFCIGGDNINTCLQKDSKACLKDKNCTLVAQVCTVDWYENGVENCASRKDRSSCESKKRGENFACTWGAEVKSIQNKASQTSEIKPKQSCEDYDLKCNYNASGGIECDNGVTYRSEKSFPSNRGKGKENDYFLKSKDIKFSEPMTIEK